MRTVVREASEAFRQLQGVFCIYKPPRVSMNFITQSISLRLTNELNDMKYSRPTHRVEIEGSITGEMRVKKYVDYSMHPLVLGPLFSQEDVSLSYPRHMINFLSGLCIMGVNELGETLSQELDEAQLITTHMVEGKLGVATRDLLYTGAPVERTSFEHVTRGRLERVLHLLQSTDQRKMVNLMGLQPNSQNAYDVMAEDGLVRPNRSKEPIIYGIKLVDLGKPHFTIEVTGINIDGDYLVSLIHDIGLRVKSTAHTLQARCLRHGPYTLDHALLRKHWKLEPIAQNIAECQGYAMDLQHKHASLTSLGTFQAEQMKLLKEKKTQRMLQEKKREDIALKMLEDFKANEEYEEFCKSVEHFKV
uniref:tRNA pseudouridine synthase 2 n=1 Tax=Hirondellea gigas TaxID=1518452 RepID=A0A2P2I2V3_9CRUS